MWSVVLGVGWKIGVKRRLAQYLICTRRSFSVDSCVRKHAKVYGENLQPCFKRKDSGGCATSIHENSQLQPRKRPGSFIAQHISTVKTRLAVFTIDFSVFSDARIHAERHIKYRVPSSSLLNTDLPSNAQDRIPHMTLITTSTSSNFSLHF